MPVEIERKFLVLNDGWRKLAGPGRIIRQSYLSHGPGGSVRIRRVGAQAFLTIKGPRVDVTRAEFEYPIPVDHAEELLGTLCFQPVLEKTRFDVPHGGRRWEIDVYPDPSRLVVAEIELIRSDEAFALPPWIGAEITRDPGYSNAAIAARLTSPATA